MGSDNKNRTDELLENEAYDTEEDKQPKNTQVLEYFNNLKTANKALEIIVRFRSSKDIDIIVVVENTKVVISKIMIESDFYTKPKLQTMCVNRQRGKILLLTKDDTTYEIDVMGKEEFDKQYKIK